jgi:mRNA interferase MazF
MLSARRGEVWLADLGMAAKARPAVILSIPFLDNERDLYAIVPHTTATRGGRFEVVIEVPWLQPGLSTRRACVISPLLFSYAEWAL